MNVLRVLIILWWPLWMGIAGATTLATVEQVQAPAWLERAGVSEALRPQTPLLTGDRIRTGPAARVYLRLAEGSRVKLGAEADFVMHSEAAQPASFFQGTLDVVTGAFRFTTDAVNRLSAQRDISIRVATATIGIRGTDVWGKAAADRELVALIEGQIRLERGGQPVTISARQYMDAPHGAPVEIKTLSPEVLATLAQQTEISPGQGASSGRGAWAVRVATVDDERSAQALYDELKRAGFAATVRSVAAGSPGLRYQLRVTGLPTRGDAAALAERIRVALSERHVPVVTRS